jgi:hypothetical protein
MSEELFEAVRRDGDILLFKLNRTWARRRIVVLRSSGRPDRLLDFPADQDLLVIPLMDGEGEVELTIRHANLPKRLLGRRESLTVPPGRGPLRALITGSGRCGTQSMALWLDGMRFRDGEPVVARHETLYEFILPYHLEGRTDMIRDVIRGFRHNLEAGPPYALMPDLVTAGRIVHLIRDGRRVVQSGLNRGWYRSESLWNRVKPDFDGTVFERCCLYWRHMVRNTDGIADTAVRLEDLVASAEARAALLADLGIVPDDRPLPESNRGARPSTFEDWSAEQHATFARICGEDMDRHYAGWRESAAV